jgi:hypothetical protein
MNKYTLARAAPSGLRVLRVSVAAAALRAPTPPPLLLRPWLQPSVAAALLLWSARRLAA